MGVVALTLVIVAILVVNRLDDYFYSQTRVDLESRETAVEAFVLAQVETNLPDGHLVLTPTGQLDPLVRAAFTDDRVFASLLADSLAQADVRIIFGQVSHDSSGTATLIPAGDATFDVERVAPPRTGQRPDAIATSPLLFVAREGTTFEYAFTVSLSEPYTFRARAVENVVGLLAVIGLIALGFAIVIAAIAARRFTAPLRRLTEASRAIAEGDYSRRLPADLDLTGAAEIAELTRQFNSMAVRLGESVEIIRRDRDLSRDFLADVSHELRTPIAAIRTFNELLREGADRDPEARSEFLESSRQQLERLDWLAQNLLELSKLDSGLVLLDLRPDDVRACVESAAEQAEPAAARRGIELTLDLPRDPLRIRHDPQRIGQVVANLVGNALKFTPRGGSVAVHVRPSKEGAQIEVTDTGVGIDADELPRIFERFYRGSRANEARGSGSGLGLAIVKSIVDMHAGRVAVESVIGRGTTFTISLPSDPRTAAPAEVPFTETTGQREVAGASAATIAERAPVADSSPTQAPSLNNPPSV